MCALFVLDDVVAFLQFHQVGVVTCSLCLWYVFLACLLCLVHTNHGGVSRMKGNALMYEETLSYAMLCYAMLCVW